MSYDPYNVNNGDSPMPYPNGINISADDPNAFGPGIPQPNAGPPPSLTQPTGDGGGGFDFGGFLQNLLGGAQSLLGGTDLTRLLAGYYAGNRAGDNMEEAAGRYRQLGTEARDWASPVSSEDRNKYKDRLNQLYEDPQAFLEGNPEYKAAMKMGLDMTNRENAMRRKNQSGEGSMDRFRNQANISSQFIDKERKFLNDAAGFQFNPASGAQMMMEGGKLEQQALQAALAAKLYPLGLMAGGQGAPNAGGGGGAAGGGVSGLINQIMGMFRGGGGGGGGAPDAASIQNLLRMFGSSPTSVSGLFPGGINAPGLDEIYGVGGGGNWDFTGSNFFPVNNLPIGDNDTDWGSIFGGGGGFPDISSFWENIDPRDWGL